MKNLITLTVAMALLASSALAVVSDEPPVQKPPETPSSSSNNDGAILGLLAVMVAIGILSSRNGEPENPPCVTDQTYDSNKVDPFVLNEC